MENPRESKQEDEEDDAECEAFSGRPFEGRERDLRAVTTVRVCEWCVGSRTASAKHTWGRIHGFSKARRCDVGAANQCAMNNTVTQQRQPLKCALPSHGRSHGRRSNVSLTRRAGDICRYLSVRQTVTQKMIASCHEYDWAAFCHTVPSMNASDRCSQVGLKEI